MSEKHPDICKIRPEIPTSVRSILDKAMQKDPEKRYASGESMKRAIKRVLKNM